MEQQEMAEAAAYAEAQGGFEKPIYLDVELGMKLIKAESKMGKKFRIVPMRNDDGKIVQYKMWAPTQYKELFTDDVTTAFCDSIDMTVLRNLEQVCAQIKAFADSHSSEGNEFDLSEAYNPIADYHNALVISSKASGKGAIIAKTGISRSTTEKRYEVPDKKEKKGKTFLETLI